MIADPPSLEETVFYAETIVVGRITSVGEARWSTPADHPRGSSSGAPEFIYTPLTLEVEAPIRGSSVGNFIETFVGGGTVGAGTAGCTRLALAGVPADLAIGQRFAIFLIDADLVPEHYRLNGFWSVAEDRVKTPYDGRLSIDDLRDRAAAVGYGPYRTPP
jgi:hypothetical protein